MRIITKYISPNERQKIIDNLRLININSIIMEYQKIINLLNMPNQPTKLRTKYLVL